MIVIFVRLFRGIRRGWSDPEFRALFFSVLVLLAGGTWFYSWAEGWSIVDSLYFSVITLTTVGYGDPAPTQPLTKLVTVGFIIVGIGLLATFVTKLASHSVRRSRSESE